MTEAPQAQPGTPTPPKKTISLSPEMSVPAAVQQIILQQSEVLHAMLPVAFIGNDIEGVHKVRVSLRRMRTCLKVTRVYYQKKILVATRIDLKFVRQVYGRVRDMDVFREIFSQSFAETHPGEDFESAIWQPVFDQTYQDFQAQIRSQVTQDIIKQLTETLMEFQEYYSILKKPDKLSRLPQDLAAFLPVILNAQMKAILQFQINPDEDRQFSSHHKLRLLIKAHRYTYEFFKSILDLEPTNIAIEALIRVQDQLGGLNDCVQAIRLVSTHQSPRLSKQISAILSEYIETQQKTQNALVETFPQIWADFLKAKPQDLLNGSISQLSA